MVDTATTSAGLAAACKNGNHSTVLTLLDRIDDPTIRPDTPWHEPIAEACRNGNVRIVRILLDLPGMDETVGNDKPLRFACLHGHLDVVRMLLDGGRVDPRSQRPSGDDAYVSWDSDPPEALSGAAANGRDDIVSLLLKRCEFPRGHVNRALERACHSGFCDTARILVEGGARPSECKRISVAGLANDHHFDVIEMLFANPEFARDDCNVRTTVFHLCASGTNDEFLKELLRR